MFVPTRVQLKCSCPTRGLCLTVTAVASAQCMCATTSISEPRCLTSVPTHLPLSLRLCVRVYHLPILQGLKSASRHPTLHTPAECPFPSVSGGSLPEGIVVQPSLSLSLSLFIYTTTIPPPPSFATVRHHHHTQAERRHSAPQEPAERRGQQTRALARCCAAGGRPCAARLAHPLLTHGGLGRRGAAEPAARARRRGVRRAACAAADVGEHGAGQGNVAAAADPDRPRGEGRASACIQRVLPEGTGADAARVRQLRNPGTFPTCPLGGAYFTHPHHTTRHVTAGAPLRHAGAAGGPQADCRRQPS